MGKNLVYDKLWRGLCGRCGAFGGNHFSNNCPKVRSVRKSRMRTFLSTKACVVPDDLGTCSNGLNMFLSRNNLDRLQKPMQKCGITSLQDLNEASVQKMLADSE